MKKIKQLGVIVLSSLWTGLSLTTSFAAEVQVQATTPVLTTESSASSAKRDEVTLRICNWEEYIDEGGWNESETIDLKSGNIIGTQSLIADFCDWYTRTYGVKVKVEYSTFGTNEDLYNMLTLGDTYDLVCPSEYMFMKLLSEDKLVPLSSHFFDKTISENYYINGVSPYLERVFKESKINGHSWAEYAAGYMWGVTGYVYNPQYLTAEQASSWKLINDPSLRRQITIKDNVRDSLFAAVGALKADELTSEDFVKAADYHERLEAAMNDTSEEQLTRVQDYLQQVKDNVYSFETDSGKADMITGKVLANYQWSGDAIYTMDQAEKDGVQLNFAVPRESTNIYFDGWVMLKSGINGNAAKQKAAEAFINFLSRPDNAIRNMYYIGYTSVIAGGEDGRIFEYLDWNYGAEDNEADPQPYNLAYFFAENAEEAGDNYTLTVPGEQLQRQLSAQYPDTQVIKRSSIMRYFTPEQNAAINRMWVNVRCYNINHLPWWGWSLLGLFIAGLVYLVLRKVQKKLSGC